jgi:hypothetical protein
MEHSDIVLDQETPTIAPAVQLKRSVILLRIYLAELLVFVFLIIAQESLEQSTFVDILAGIAGLGMVVLFAISPLGIFYSFKAFRKKEANATVRLWHLICHLFVFVLVAAFLFIYIISAE